jgi:hypothetical protein
MKNARPLHHALKAAAVLSAAIFLVACNPVENKSQSASLLTVTRIRSTDALGNEVGFLQSDVLYVDPLTGAQSWRADAATATLSASTLEPDPRLGTSEYYDIQVTRYVVTYIRSDGMNREGVDVPYSFEAGLSILVSVGQPTDISFVIVREVAKQEPPLVGLRQALPGDELNVTAKVEFYGHDLANKEVKATGYLPVFFGNYGN